MNLLTSLALLGFVSRALAHAQLILLAEMQENSTKSRADLNFPPSHSPVVDAVSTEFTSIADENISDLLKGSYDASNQEGTSDSSDSSDILSILNERATIPSGATQLPGLHGITPLIWRWNEAINQTKHGRNSNRVERKSNDFAPRSSSDFAPRSSSDCTNKNVDDRSSFRPTDLDDVTEDESLNQRTGGGSGRRSSSGSQTRPSSNRGGSGSRNSFGDRRQVPEDSEGADWNEDSSGDEESTHFTKRRDNRRRRPIKESDRDTDESDDNEDVHKSDDDEDKLDRRQDSGEVDVDDDEGSENTRGFSHSTSGRRVTHRNRNYDRNYPSRRRNQGYKGDSGSNRKPYAKRPDLIEPAYKPYPKENSPSVPRRFKGPNKPYSAPRPAGFPNVNLPEDDTLISSFRPDNSKNPFIPFSESPDDSIGLEDGATILDTLTGQTYEISLTDSTGSRSSSVLPLVSESIDGSPYVATKANYERPSAVSLDSLLQTLLVRSSKPSSALTLVEPMVA